MTANLINLAQQIKQWGQQLGFQQVGITDTDLSNAEQHLTQWLKKDYHGTMSYMYKHGKKRSQPEQLIPNTCRIISVRMDYLPAQTNMLTVLNDPALAYISRYALGRDYHKILRKRLKLLATKITAELDDCQYRVFTDSAPVLEKPLAEKAGLGWIGKHTNLINKKAGSWFFLGEIYINIALPVDEPATNHCGQCQNCIDICPTQAIVAPYQLDARRCISYLTIEHHGSIPVEFRRAMGNRIYGCDDCQQVCPWNRFAKPTVEPDFAPRHQLDHSLLLTLFAWTETEFLKRTEGSAIRRIGHQRWLRNIAIALGNSPYHPDITQALNHPPDTNDIIQEHCLWALQQQQQK